jgi:isoleucyl-tRNA synthetase
MARIPDVGNPWLDAGIVPYSTITEPPPAHSSSSEGRVKERHLDKPANSSPQSLTSSPNQLNPESGIPHYLNNRQAWQNWFPADFITESFPGQFKNWFYSMIAMSTVLENQPPYKRVLGFGTLLAEDGRAMHKSWGNSIEFNQGADEMGVDVMRFMYALANPADNMLFGPKGAGLIRRKFLLILWNVYNFFITYANTDNWQPTAYTPYYRRKTKRSYLNQITNSSTLKSPHMPVEGLKTNNILDTWILTRLHQTTQSVTQNLENYQSQPATQALLDFVDDLSTWYVRRSRTRLGPTATDQIDKQDCYETLYQVLTTLSKLIAPITPFIADEIYTNLTGEQSVHLANWPAAHKKSINNDLLTNMELSRKIVTIIHANRKLKGINIRQPLKSISYDVLNRLPTELEDLILSETNIKNISHEPSSSKLENPVVTINWELTPELKAEGQAREIIRQIQIARKEANCQLNDKITVQLPDWPKDFENLIKHQTLTAKLVKGKKLNIIKR